MESLVMLPAIYLVRQLDFSDPQTLLYARIAFGVAQTIAVIGIYLINSKIKGGFKGDDKTITMKKEASLGSIPEEGEMETITVAEYDSRKLVGMIKSLVMRVCIIGFIHYKWGSGVPLVIQLISTPMTLYKDPLTKIHILGQTGKELERPFKPPASPFAAFMNPEGESTDAAASTKKEN
eukprot:TRINITY_DN139_c1_g4_i2.p1 TRINITY_DN139_c1_g4~~TRINITY_DN139_c1_g4_i2.p1  ORF type:complete len:179 (+),score=47.89 TRINITY_DN139_c1_g4_i2:63-599(+)